MTKWSSVVPRVTFFEGADRLPISDVVECLLRSRCGIVDSPYPSHGTRTGFYTDELDELYFQPPESIRKASLVGCDLRGATIEGVDFYLVDLRDAILEPAQRSQIAASGGILQ